MGIFDGIFGKGEDTSKDTTDDNTDDTVKLRLREEALDIAKNSVQKGEVEFSKEIIEEHKVVDVPVTREEVVIERKSFNNEVSDSPIAHEQTIRIPVAEEKVDVAKHTVVTGEVSAHKRVIQETQHIDETLKREEARINKTGNPDVVDNSINQD